MKRGWAVPALLGAVTIWGTTFVATKLALRDLGPFALTLVRFLLALLALLPLAWRERCHAAARAPLPWRALALAGLLGGGLYFALQNLGLLYTTASEASLILACIPALVALLSALLLRERIGLLRAAGVAASVLGVAVIVVADRAARWQGSGLLGDLLIVATAVAWAAYTVLGKHSGGRATPAVLSAATVGFGALFLLPLAGYEALTRPLPALTGEGAPWRRPIWGWWPPRRPFCSGTMPSREWMPARRRSIRTWCRWWRWRPRSPCCTRSLARRRGWGACWCWRGCGQRGG